MLEPLCGLTERGGAQAQLVLTSQDVPMYQSRAFQHLHVLGHAVERNREAGRQIADIDLPAGEGCKYGASRWIGNGRVDAIQALTLSYGHCNHSTIR